MRRERTVIAIIAGATLAVSASLAFAQPDHSSAATRPGPTPGPSSGMPSDLDTTGMGGGQPGCMAPPGGTTVSVAPPCPNASTGLPARFGDSAR